MKSAPELEALLEAATHRARERREEAATICRCACEGLDVRTIAERIGRSRKHIRRTLRAAGICPGQSRQPATGLPAR